MIDVNLGETSSQLVLEPNRSMSWQANKRILLAMFLVNLLIGVSFALVGAWMILPFAGLEILLVGIGMYYVCWKLNFKEVITVESESFVLEKGVYYPKQRWQWQRSNTSLLKHPSPYRMSAPKLVLSHLNDSIEVGEFLNRTEKKMLVEGLCQIGIKTVVLSSE